MMISFESTVALINKGKLLHISGTEALLRKLPKGNWIGGSTEYFMAESGGQVTDALLDVCELSYPSFKFVSYDDKSISQITSDAYENGFSIIIIPFDSAVHKTYAQDASTYKDIFLKNIVGWISGLNLNKANQTPIAVNGKTGEVFTDKAAVLHIELPEGKVAVVNVVNIFSQDLKGPVVTFNSEGFSVKTCLVDGKEVNFASYINDKEIDTKLPLVGDYSGAGVNISIKEIKGDTVYLYAPVFKGINYRFAKMIQDYSREFNTKIKELGKTTEAFSCNCILNFLYGELENKKFEAFFGPITFGEIAGQLVNQTLVYLQVI